jgi:hypothetical protein
MLVRTSVRRGLLDMNMSPCSYHVICALLTAVDLTVARGAHPRNGIRELLRGAFKRDLQFVGAYRAWREAVLSEPDLASRDDAFRRWTQERVIAVFERLQQSPGARRDVNVHTLGCVMDRLFRALLSEFRRLNEADAQLWLETAADITYHALFTDSASEGL